MGKGLLLGNALEVLKSLPESYVDCVITSPPYYLLRDYGEETVFIWDGDQECEHEWTDEVSFTARGSYENANVGNNKKGVDPRVKRLGSFCKKCGAWKGQLGHEPSPDLYIKHLADVFDQVYRVLKPDGNVFIVIGDTYASGGIKSSFGKLDYIDNKDFYGYAKQSLLKNNKGTWIREKQLLLIPYRLAIELQNRGWIVRDLIIWAKKVYSVNHDFQFGNGLPESVKDRLTKSYEVIIHAVKSERYYFNKPKVQAKESTLRRALYGKSPGKYEGLPFYGGGGKGISTPRQYAGKYAYIDAESVGSIRARLLRSKFLDAEDINIGSAISGRVLKNLLNGKEHTLVRKGLTDVNGYLKQKLKESGLSLDVLSKITGIKKTTLEHYFRVDPSGSALPSREAWEAMKEVLGLCEYEECVKEEYKSVLPEYDAFAFVGNVVHCNTEPTKEKHYAVMPSKLVEFLIRMGCREGGVVLDPFGGTGTTAKVAESMGRRWIVIEANGEYVQISKKKLKWVQKRLF